MTAGRLDDPMTKMRSRSGFTLIEVLVTLVILTFGLLGLAGLIMKGHRASFEAYQRHQALTIVNDLAERIKANQSMSASIPNNIDIAKAYVREPAKAVGDPASLLGAPAVDCDTAPCTRIQMVAYDLYRWQDLLLGKGENLGAGNNRGGIMNARGCVEGPLAAPSPLNTFRISVAWQGDTPTVEPQSSKCGVGVYRDGAGVNEATRRVVSTDITVLVQAP